jgi:hypothetical protein
MVCPSTTCLTTTTTERWGDKTATMDKGDGQEAQTLDEENQPGPKEIEGGDENEPQP